MLESITELINQEYTLHKNSDCYDRNLQKKPILYLAAAVSDFYIPYDILPEHKIQSRDIKPEPLSSDQTVEVKNHDENLSPALTIHLYKTQKLLSLVRQLAPELVMVSFKLETDANILEKKVEKSFEENGSDFIIGNLL
jgi:phosphopantothenate---cysteine ligase (ATP)